LVTYDLMFGILRPAPQAVVDAIVSDMWREFYAAQRRYRQELLDRSRA
jgi:hypothetical protein